MDDSGQIYSDCEKCGSRVLFDRECSECGTPSGAAKTLADLLEVAIVDEMPDPLGVMRDKLREEHQKRERMRRR